MLEDSTDLMNLVRHELRFPKTQSRFLRDRKKSEQEIPHLATARGEPLQAPDLVEMAGRMRRTLANSKSNANRRSGSARALEARCGQRPGCGAKSASTPK